MNKHQLILGSLGFVFFTNLGSMAMAQSSSYTGTLYAQNSKRGEKLYNLKIESKALADGKTEVVATYTDVQGNIVVEEKSVLEASKLVKYEVDHKQSGQKGSVEVVGEKVNFSHTQDGKTKVSDEKLGSSLVISGNFGRFIKDNIEQIKAGKEVGFRYAAWQRRETVGFEVFKISEEKVNGEDAVVIKMKPSSFIIAALVKPLIMKYSSDGSRILELNGRVPPMRKSGDSFKDFDAEVVYQY